MLDPFMGSGTTGAGGSNTVATGYLGIELLPEYVELAKGRVEG